MRFRSVMRRWRQNMRTDLRLTRFNFTRWAIFSHFVGHRWGMRKLLYNIIDIGHIYNIYASEPCSHDLQQPWHILRVYILIHSCRKPAMMVFTIYYDDRIFHRMMRSFATVVEDIDTSTYLYVVPIYILYYTQLDTHERYLMCAAINQHCKYGLT